MSFNENFLSKGRARGYRPKITQPHPTFSDTGSLLETENLSCLSSKSDKDGSGEGASVRNLDLDTLSISNKESYQCSKDKGTSGTRVRIFTNLFELITKNIEYYQYVVKFSPEISSIQMRKEMLQSVLIQYKTIYEFDGMCLYTRNQLIEQSADYQVKRKTDNAIIEMNIKFVSKLSSNSATSMQLYNITFNKCLTLVGLQLVGRNYFSPHHIDLDKYKLQIWPGYITSILRYEKGINLIADISHRILASETIYDKLNDIYMKNRNTYEEISKSQLIGTIVLTRYNNKTYKVDDIDWSKNPTFKITISNQEMSLVEYYKKQYKFSLKEDQPLLVVMPKKRSFNKQITYLIPQLCFLTGLSDIARNDRMVMKEISGKTRVDPGMRLTRLRELLQKINSNKESIKELDNWDLKLKGDLMSTEARQLDPEFINLKNSYTGQIVEFQYPKFNTDWMNFVKQNSMLQPVNINNWVLIVPERDYQIAEKFFMALQTASKKFGMKLAEPNVITLKEPTPYNYSNAMKTLNSDIEFAMVLMPSAREDLYCLIKKRFCLELPIPSQIMLVKTISRENMMMSVAMKVALQINCKMGGECWSVKIPLKNVMVIGLDDFQDTKKLSHPVFAMVASLNKNMTQYHSYCNFQGNDDALNQSLFDGMTKCIQAYIQANGVGPEKIIVYRDGVGDGQFERVKKFELEALKKAFTNFGPNYHPGIAMIVVQKRVNARFFLDSGNIIRNPLAGTVIDSDATRPNCNDFFIVSQSVNQGTVGPTHYNVLYDDTGLKADHLQKLTYKLCHLYYNWTGTIRVPAVCMYAHRLAGLTGQNIKVIPSVKLADKLFYI